MGHGAWRSGHVGEHERMPAWGSMGIVAQPYLVEVEHQVKLTDVLKVMVQDLHKKVDCLQIQKLVVAHIHAEREEQTSISPVDNLVGPELHDANEDLKNASVSVSRD